MTLNRPDTRAAAEPLYELLGPQATRFRHPVGYPVGRPCDVIVRHVQFQGRQK